MKMQFAGRKKLFYIISLFLCFCLITLSTLFLFAGCTQKASSFSIEEHLERVSKLVEKRYMTEDGEYTSYEVFPLYDKNEELKFFVVEFEPCGYVYVKLNEKDLSSFWQHSMYTRCAERGYSLVWRRYTVEIGLESTITYGNFTRSFHDRKWEVDDNGEFIDYYDSHFKIANIQNEKRYFLTITQNGVSGYIPAVKRGDKYLNLVSMQEMIYERELDSQEYSTADISFFSKPELNL